MDTHSLNRDQIAGCLVRAMQETFVGTSGDNGAFLRKEDPWLLPIMRLLTAREASQPVAGTSIVAHVRHVISCLDSFLADMEGTAPYTEEWKDSLHESAVDEDEWLILQDKLESGMKAFARVASTLSLSGESNLWAALGAFAHNAYHLGAIQVKLEQMRKQG
jgi:hypothetical protein